MVSVVRDCSFKEVVKVSVGSLNKLNGKPSTSLSATLSHTTPLSPSHQTCQLEAAAKISRPVGLILLTKSSVSVIATRLLKDSSSVLQASGQRAPDLPPGTHCLPAPARDHCITELLLHSCSSQVSHRQWCCFVTVTATLFDLFLHWVRLWWQPSIMMWTWFLFYWTVTHKVNMYSFMPVNMRHLKDSRNTLFLKWPKIGQNLNFL